MPRMSKANRLRHTAEVLRVHEQNPEARAEIKREGLEVGKLVRYYQEMSEQFGGVNERFGVVKEIHRTSVVVQQNTLALFGPDKAMVIEETDIPFANVKEIVGPGIIATEWYGGRRSTAKSLPEAPTRSEGYDACDICKSRKPCKVYVTRKYDDEIGELSPPSAVAVCKSCDEPWPSCTEGERRGMPERAGPGEIPIVWKMGVVFETYSIPRKSGDDQLPGNRSDNEPEFETCWCGKEFGHRGFHRKARDGEDD